MFKKLLPYVGPARMVFKDPDTGREFQAKSKQDLIFQIVSYRTQNQLEPISELSSVIENYWCSLPENRGNCTRVTMKRGFLQYIKGGIALLVNVFLNDQVSQEEADRRAEICVGCTYNEFPKKRSFDAWADSMAVAMVGDRKSKLHKQLGNCGVCSCPLRGKVFWKGNIDLSPEERKKMELVGCWQAEPDIGEKK